MRTSCLDTLKRGGLEPVPKISASCKKNGGGGDRTRVRWPSSIGSTCLVLPLMLTV